MAFESARRVVIDDTHPSIQFSADPRWFIAPSGLKDHIGNFGKVFNRTLHGTDANGTFSFSFSGTSVNVFGTNDIRNVSGVIDPLWKCYVDDQEILASAPFSKPENNWRMCGVDKLPDTNHTLTVRVESLGQTFWFDYLLYVPSANIVPDDSLILISEKDPALTYDTNWQQYNNTYIMTRVHNASMSFQFTGASISWYGVYPKELSVGQTLATYSIDGGTETAFAIQSLPSNASSAYFQLMFRADIYPTGPHTLNVTFKGDSTTTPLSLDYLLVQTPTSNRTTTASTTPISSIVAIVNKSNKTFLSIMGLVFGVLAVLSAVAAFLLFFYMKHRKQKRTKREVVVETPNPPPPTPGLDLASSSPSLGLGSVEGQSRGSRWFYNLRGSLLNTLGQAPPLGVIAATNASVTELQSPKPNSPTSRWVLSKKPERNSDEGHVLSHWTSAGLVKQRGREQGGQAGPSRGLAVVVSPDTEFGGDSIPPSSSPASAIPPSVSPTDGDASYYGGYRTKREMMELERNGRKQPSSSDLS